MTTDDKLPKCSLLCPRRWLALKECRFECESEIRDRLDSLPRKPIEDVTDKPTAQTWSDSIETEHMAMEVYDTHYAVTETQISHDDWELLAVGDLAPYYDPRYKGEPRKAQERGRQVLRDLHRLLFGGKTVEECGCDE